MHPREGWSEGGIRRRPDPLQSAISRRQLLAAGAGLALGGMLAGCGGSNSTGGGGPTGSGGVPLPRQDNPVKWPIFADNKPIAAGMAPEKGATLEIYNWVAYINEAVIKSFCKKHNCNYSLTTFNTMEEAISKLASGQLKFDVFFPTVDVLGQLIEAKFIRPLNQSYIPNIANTWADYRNPFYDQGWQYTTPYSIYTSGMAWRKDKVNLAPSWNMPWEGAAYKGKVAVLDDDRETIGLALLKAGNLNLNTTDTAQIQAAGKSLQQLASLTNVRIDNNDYTDVPTGKTWIHHAWSGDMAAVVRVPAQGHLGRHARLLVPGRPQGPGRQRSDGQPDQRLKPRPCAHVHQLPARREQRAGELQLRRLHAAADRGHPGKADLREAAAAAADLDRRATGLLPSRHLRTRVAAGRHDRLGGHLEHLLEGAVG